MEDEDPKVPHSDVRQVIDGLTALRDALAKFGLESSSVDRAVELLARQSREIARHRRGWVPVPYHTRKGTPG